MTVWPAYLKGKVNVFIQICNLNFVLTSFSMLTYQSILTKKKNLFTKLCRQIVRIECRWTWWWWNDNTHILKAVFGSMMMLIPTRGDLIANRPVVSKLRWQSFYGKWGWRYERHVSAWTCGDKWARSTGFQTIVMRLWKEQNEAIPLANRLHSLSTATLEIPSLQSDGTLSPPLYPLLEPCKTAWK